MKLSVQTKLERLLYRELLNEISKGGGNEESMREWAKETTRKVMGITNEMDRK